MSWRPPRRGARCELSGSDFRPRQKPLTTFLRRQVPPRHTEPLLSYCKTHRATHKHTHDTHTRAHRIVLPKTASHKITSQVTNNEVSTTVIYCTRPHQVLKFWGLRIYWYVSDASKIKSLIYTHGLASVRLISGWKIYIYVYVC